MKKTISKIAIAVAIVVLVILVIAAITLCVGLLRVSMEPYKVTDNTIGIKQTNIPNANRHQNNASVVLIPVDDQLYYYVRSWPGALGRRSKFDMFLCSIEQGKISRMEEIDFLFGTDGQFVYHQREDLLICYNIEKNEEWEILPLTEFHYVYHLDDDGILRIIPDEDSNLCYWIKSGEIIAVTEEPPDVEYQLGEKTYRLSKKLSSKYKLYCQDEDISDQLATGKYRAIVPYLNGLLLINDGYGTPVYYINDLGEIRALFPEIPCMCATSSVNFYENYVFLSFKRWEGYAGIGMSSYENDTLEGTYRIDMVDGTTEKISDQIYNGMFIFDDSGIFCTNRNGDIMKIDFDGNVLIPIVD